MTRDIDSPDYRDTNVGLGMVKGEHDQLCDQVDKLETNYRRMKELCGHIVETLKVNADRGLIQDDITELAKNWHRQYMSILEKVK